ncbi:MAG: type 1 glutamine amidotransferase domain-containing protein [Anaerolineae bacterium]
MRGREKNRLQGLLVAALVTQGFEEDELVVPRRALMNEGAEVRVVAPTGGEVRAWQHGHWGERLRSDVALELTDARVFGALLLPGGVISADRLRMEQRAVAFARDMWDQGKPIAAICHGPWLLIEAEVVQGLTVTSYLSLRTDLLNAGAHWRDEPVVEDAGVITSRAAGDLPAFVQATLSLFARAAAGEPVRERAPAGVGP